MTPVPADLAALRVRVANSYRMTDSGWRADPTLVDQLCAAEAAWTRQVAEQRKERP